MPGIETGLVTPVIFVVQPAKYRNMSAAPAMLPRERPEHAHQPRVLAPDVVAGGAVALETDREARTLVA